MRYIFTSVLLIWGFTLPATGGPGPAAAAKAGHEHGEPHIEVLGGRPTERARLMLAISRFDEAGLALPDLVIEFFDGESEPCQGHTGFFEPSSDPWRISICDGDAGWVYEHELAHAWERANLDDDTRRRFIEQRDYPVWADSHAPWNQRGVEGVALVIQQGLSGLPLPPALSDEHRSRLEAYEMLTGRPDPRLADWQDLHGGPTAVGP